MWLRDMLISIGRRNIEREEQQRRKDYVPNKYGGEWVNKGTWDDEEWVWEEDNISCIPIYIHVYLTNPDTSDVTIRITYHKDAEALATINGCENDRDVQNALRLLDVRYREYNVTIVREIP